MKNFGWFIFSLFIGYFIFLIRQDIIDNLELKRAVQRMEQGLAQAADQSTELQDKLKLLNNHDYLEQLARSRLGLVKKGETAYKIIN